MPHSLANPFDKRKPPTLTNAEAVEKVSGSAARQAMEELLSHKEAPIEDTEIHMTDEERAAFEAEQVETKWESRLEKKRKEYIAWATSFGQDEEWVDETFTFNTDGTVEVEGDLDAFEATTPFPEGLTRVGGHLYLNGLTSAKGLVLPREVGGDFFLNGLKFAKGLTFPEKVGGNLDLNNLTSAEDLTAPENVGGSLFLNSLTSAKGLVLPREVGRVLYLGDLTSAEGLALPESFNGYLYVGSLSQAERKKLKQRYPTVKLASE